MKIMIDKLAPYLPYELQCKFIGLDGEKYVGTLASLTTEWQYECAHFYIDEKDNAYTSMIHLEDIRPILHPLSDLTDEFISEKNLDFLDEIELRECRDFYKQATHLRYDLCQYLFQWHFDVFNLHSKGLCIYYEDV